jgi:hypothetical protein
VDGVLVALWQAAHSGGVGWLTDAVEWIVATLVTWHRAVQMSPEVCGTGGTGCSDVKFAKWQMVQSSVGECAGLPWQASQTGGSTPALCMATTSVTWHPLLTQLPVEAVCFAGGAG